MIRFAPARLHGLAALCGFAMCAYTVWSALHWWPAWLAAALLAASSAGEAWLALRPVVEITSSHLLLGRRAIEWSAIRRVDQTNWISPMVVLLALVDGTRQRLVYPGHAVHGHELLGLIQQHAVAALINGVPHSRIFGAPVQVESAPSAAPRPRFLSDSDEAEIERMVQQLKSAGHIDGATRSDQDPQ